MSEDQKISVDIGAAMEALKANPELAQQMNELVLGKVAADELADAHAKNAALIALLRQCRETLKFYAEEWGGGYSNDEPTRLSYAPSDALLADSGDKADDALIEIDAATAA